jgi:hypothetical protein
VSSNLYIIHSLEAGAQPAYLNIGHNWIMFFLHALTSLVVKCVGSDLCFDICQL